MIESLLAVPRIVAGASEEEGPAEVELLWGFSMWSHAVWCINWGQLPRTQHAHYPSGT